MLRNYTNLAVPVALQSAIDGDSTVLSVASTAGYPDVPFTLSLDRNTENEEVVLCTAKGASSFTVERGYDGTANVAHDASTPIEHVVCAIDYREANEHIQPTGWTTMTLLNGWEVRSPRPPEDVAYRKDPHGVVHLRGTLQSVNATAITAATLPVGFRPFSDVRRYIFPTTSVVEVYNHPHLTVSQAGPIYIRDYGPLGGDPNYRAQHVELGGISWIAE